MATPNGLFANASLPFSMRSERHRAHRALGLWFSRVHEIYSRRPARVTVPFGAAHALGPPASVPVWPHARRRQQRKDARLVGARARPADAVLRRSDKGSARRAARAHAERARRSLTRPVTASSVGGLQLAQVSIFRNCSNSFGYRGRSRLIQPLLEHGRSRRMTVSAARGSAVL